MAEEAQREGAPGQEVRAEGGPDPDKLQALQHDVLAAVRASDADDSTSSNDSAEVREPVLQSVQPALRRFTGTKRTERVGPLRFTPEELERLHTAAAAHGYWGTSGIAADVTLAFIDGQFFVDLPLAEERRQTHVFRARVLRHLNKIGHNVNQIARAFNGAYQPHPDFREQLDELRALLTQIAEALRPSANVEEA
ncbi:MobC family plasmid mobilization relaxosome protein [Streptacidiphilus sp. PB12-B1b]|uniref:MobC family plasmid mobilization relaxosome protein n=1 Tax=Streptacidiphilus sp. PB12-B1b TaxID=2705012 RepID=UPI0015F7B981|nr:MobC family plasmid mobilization relaxosome protein [Streptacidiphilus sp. PB12-B1b]QMU74602.1 MobC family plasmid mobilization relaxosome protein [Streptacidiphilus sp. PB12-B1b]